MTLEWTLPAAVGLMVGISLGVLIELRYVVVMDRKIERMLKKVGRIELRTERELLGRMRRAKPKSRAKKVKSRARKSKKRTTKRRTAKRTTKKRRR